MAGSIKVSFLEKAQVAQAAILLAKVFNESARVMAGELAAGFSDEPYKPVILAATVNDKVVGLIECDTGPDYESSNVYALSKLAIDPDYRGHGIGQRLVQAAESFVGAEWMKGVPGTVALIDGTKQENPQSRFYEKMDYKADTPAVLRDGLPVLKKRLNERPPEPHRQQRPSFGFAL